METFVFRFGNCELSEVSGELRVAGELVDIEPRPRAVLLILLRRAGELVPKDELLDTVWEGRSFGDQAVSNTVAKVRKALGDTDNTVVRNERNKGYRLAVAVDRRPAYPAGFVNLTAGRQIPGRTNWRLLEKLGCGGFGDVWLCQSKDGEPRVFKFATAPEHDVALKREVTLCRLLQAALSEEQKQGCVELLEWNLEHRPYYIEFEYAGENLRAWASKRGGLIAISLAERLEIMANIATAVGSAHSIGILHKDLKPENVLIDERDGHRRICLSDFGAGHLLDAETLNRFDITKRGMTKVHTNDARTGTFTYMAPELFEGGQPTWQSDIYSLGVLLYQIVVEDFDRLLSADWVPDIEDPLLREDIEFATRRDPRQRLSDAQQLGRRLRTLDQRRADREQQRAAQDRAAKVEEQLRRARARRPWMQATLGLLALCLAIALYFFVREVRLERAALAMKSFIENNVVGREDPIYYGGDPPMSFLDPVLQSQPIGMAEVALQQSTVDYDARVYGDRDRHTVAAQVDLARTLVLLGRAQDAGTALNDANVNISALSPSDPLRLDVEYVRALLLRVDMRLREAAVQFESLVRTCDTAANVNSDFCLRVEFHAAKTFYRAMEYQQAEQRTRTLLDKVTLKYGNGSAAMAARVQLGAILLKVGNLKEAEANLQTAENWLVRSSGATDLSAIEAVQYLAEAAEISGDWENAIRLRTDARERIARLSGSNSTPVRHADLLLARTLMHAGHADEAIVLARSVLSALNQNEAPFNLLAATQVTLLQLLLSKHLDHAVADNFNVPEEQSVQNDVPLRGLIWYVRAQTDSNPDTAQLNAAHALDLLRHSEADGGVDVKEIEGFIARPGRAVLRPAASHG